MASRPRKQVQKASRPIAWRKLTRRQKDELLEHWLCSPFLANTIPTAPFRPRVASRADDPVDPTLLWHHLKERRRAMRALRIVDEAWGSVFSRSQGAALNLTKTRERHGKHVLDIIPLNRVLLVYAVIARQGELPKATLARETSLKASELAPILELLDALYVVTIRFSLRGDARKRTVVLVQERPPWMESISRAARRAANALATNASVRPELRDAVRCILELLKARDGLRTDELASTYVPRMLNLLIGPSAFAAEYVWDSEVPHLPPAPF